MKSSEVSQNKDGFRLHKQNVIEGMLLEHHTGFPKILQYHQKR